MDDEGAVPHQVKPTRRGMLFGAGATAAAVWVAPTILSVDAAKAATLAPGNTVLPVFGFYQSESTSGSSVSATLMNLTSPGLLIGVVAFRGGTLVTATPAGWTLEGSVADPDGDGALYVYSKVQVDSTETFTVSLVVPARNVTAALLFYGQGASVEPAGPTTFASGTDANVTANAITTTGSNRVVLYIAGWKTGSGTSSPPGFTNRGNVTNGELSMTISEQNVLSPATVGPTSGPLVDPTQWGAGQIAIVGVPV